MTRPFPIRSASARALAVLAPALITAAVAGCAGGGAESAGGRILAVGAESQYANVISQIGGRYVSVTAIEDNPNTDPHSFEASPSVAGAVSSAAIVVQNGVGYDDFMSKIEAAASNPSRRVIDVQHLLGLPESTPNPHLWYRPDAMPAVAGSLARELAALQPKHAAYFRANAARFDAALLPWDRALNRFARSHPRTPVAVTEPVADYMLQAAGADIVTPFSLQADVMNGVDPAPQSVSFQDGLFSGHRVKVFVYNEQVTDSVTQDFLTQAAAHGIPVVAVYETMPAGYDYQRWMLAEVAALSRAVDDHDSTEKL
jgi:zinc/manganese transport system substrate-binding protein